MEISLELLASYATAVVALGMSLYNYWRAQQGAKLSLGPLVELGGMLNFSPQTRQEHLLLYMPLHLFNEGTKTAMITDISMTAEGPEGTIPMFLMKRVQGRTSEEIESEQPIFPVFVEAGQGTVATFEFMDGPDVAMKLDQTYQITIMATYNTNRSSSRTYTLTLSRDAVPKFPQLNWFHVQRAEETAPPPIIFGKDLKR